MSSPQLKGLLQLIKKAGEPDVVNFLFHIVEEKQSLKSVG
jgi:hypothetical protein